MQAKTGIATWEERPTSQLSDCVTQAPVQRPLWIRRVPIAPALAAFALGNASTPDRARALELSNQNCNWEILRRLRRLRMTGVFRR